MFRTGVSALITNDRSQFLLVNLESFAEKYFAVPGGGLEPGENLEDAVYREIFEELGIAKENLVLVGKSDKPVRVVFKEIVLARDGKEYAGQERFFLGFHYRGSNEQITLREGEVRKYAWVDMADLKDYLLFDNQLEETVAKISEIFPAMARSFEPR